MDTINTLLTLLGIAGLSQALTWAKPFRMILSYFNLDDNEEVDHRHVAIDHLGVRPICDSRFSWINGAKHLLLRELFACSICMSFWISLIITQDLWMAGVTLVITKCVEYLHAVTPIKIDID